MNYAKTTVLLVEYDPVYARQIKAALTGATVSPFGVEWVTQLSDALIRLDRAAFEVVLLDLMLPDGQGIAVFEQVLQAAPDSLILILSAEGDEEVAHLAVQRGAQDYFVKSHADTHWLPRTVRYAIECKASQDALRSSEARFRAISDASPVGIFVSDVHGGCIYTNAAYQEISRLTLEQTLDSNWSIAIHPEDRQHVMAEWHSAVLGHEPFQTEFRFLREDGSVVWTRVNSTALGDGKKLFGRVMTVEDISERKLVESELRATEEDLFEQKERAQFTLNSIGDAVLVTDLLGNLTYLNPVAERMTGWPSEAALGQPLSQVFKIIHDTTRQTIGNPAQRAIEEDRTVGLASDCVLICRDGSEAAIEDSTAPIHNKDGGVSGAVIVFRDVSVARAMALKMTHLAQHDFLTDLPNRVLLTERITQAIMLAQRHHKLVALLFVDLDHFKYINDTLGHAIGDQLLQSVADRLLACVRATDTVCRQGGDEFVILLTEIEQSQDAAHFAEKIRTVLATPCTISGHELTVTLSIGISIYPDDGMNVDSVMQNADTAMYYAKAKGRNNYQFFSSDMKPCTEQRLSGEASRVAP